MSHSTEEVTRTHIEAKEILQQIEARGTPLSSEMKQKAEEIIVNMLLDGTLPKDSIGLTPVFIEKMYLYAYNLFQAGKFNDALRYFNILHNLDPLDSRYWFALGACYHYLKNYSLAAAHYMRCIPLDPLNPVPHFHMYDCFMQSQKPLNAYSELKIVINLAGDNPLYATLKEKAQLEAGFLEQYMLQYAKEHANESKNRGGE